MVHCGTQIHGKGASVHRFRYQEERHSENRFIQPNLTKNREYKAIAKTIDFDGKKKIFFDAVYVNASVKYTPQIFLEQLLEVYAEDIISFNYKVPNQFYSETPLTEVLRIFFFQWSTKVVTNIIS